MMKDRETETETDRERKRERERERERGNYKKYIINYFRCLISPTTGFFKTWPVVKTTNQDLKKKLVQIKHLVYNYV